MGKIKSGIRGLILLVIASSAMFLTCDIGLGRSVDTKPPALTIAYPPVQSVIKNSFTMTGSASDDTALASVSVTAVNTLTAVTYGPYAATLDPATGTWSVVVNNRTESGFELRDGTYEMTVAALDGASRRTVSTTTYEIDNTAPVVVIERPGSYGPITEANPGETYGTELKLTGSINDDHAIDKLVFTAYDTAGTPVGSPLVQTNISGVAMDITLAKYYSSPASAEEVSLNNLYNSIYTGYDSATGKFQDQSFYCTITVSDAAREFNPPAASASADNSRGNINSAYYLYDDIYSQVFADTGFAVTMKDLTAIFNGSYADAAKAQSVLAVLAQKSRPSSTWSTASASFSLNPTNSPTYEVKGFASISATNPIEGMKKTNGTDLTILVKAGRDGVPLLSDTLKVYLDPCGSSGANPDPAASDIVLLNTVAELGSDTGAIASRAAKITKSGTDYSIFVNIGAIATKTNYRLRVEGSDQNGKTLEEQNYGFRVITNGKPPAVTIGSTLAADLPDPTPANLDTINKSSVTCIGYVTSETGLVSLPATVTVLNTVTNAVVATHTVNLASSVGSALTATKWTLPIDVAADTTTVGLYQYTVALTATDEEGNSTAATRIFYVDREPPKVEFNAPTPVVDVAGTNYVNGTVRYSGRITDNYGVYSASYSLDGGATFTPIANPISWTTANIDTTNYDDPMGIGTLTLTVAMTDKAGNTALGSTSVLIDQATDKPVINLSNANTAGLITDPANIDKDHNLFGTLTNNRIYGTIKDDDKLGTSVTVRIDGTTVNVAQISIASPGSTYSIDYAPRISGAALSEGVHTIEFIAVDEAGVSSSTGVFYIGIDEAAPTLEITSPAQGTFCSGTLAVAGTARDSSGVVTLVRKEAGPPDTAITVAADDSWTDNLAVGTTTGTYTRVYTATDKYGRTTNVSLTYQIDSTAPGVAITTPVDTAPADGIPDQVYVKKENVYQVIGTASDVGSTVTSVFFKIQPAATLAPTTVDGSWTQAVGTTNWTANVNLSNDVTYPEGDYKVYIASKDSAGNYSAIAAASTVLIHADKDAPAINVTTPPAAYVKGTIAFSGTATDTNIDTVTYTRSATIPANSGSGSLTTGGWSISNAALADDSYAYTITATDKAGRISTAQVSTVKDSAVPVTEISSITKQLTKEYPGPLTRTNVVNGLITVKGTISDNDKVATGTYTLRSNGVDVPGRVGVSLGANLTSWSFDVDTTMAGITDLANLVVEINATDRAGNPATLKTQTVYVDQSTDKPVITLSNANVGITTAVGVTAANNLFGTTSNNKILGTITDDDKLAASVTVRIDGTDTDVTQITIGSPGTTYSLEYVPMKSSAILAEGKHSIEFIARDDAGVETTTGIFWIGIDAGDPSIAVTEPAQNGYYSGLITIKGTASDGSGIATVVSDSSATDLHSGTSWTDASFDVGTTTGVFTRTYTATDIYGRTKTATFTYNVDATPPTLSDISPAAPVYIKMENVYQVTGKAADDSGVLTAVLYKVVAGTPAAPAIDGSWSTAVGTADWAANVNLSSLAEGDYTVFIASKDRASNYSTIASVVLHADKNEPALTVTPPAAYLNGTTVAFTVSASDTNINELSYTRTGLGAPVSVATANVAGLTVNDTIPAGVGSDGTYEYVFTVTDNAGRSKTYNYTVVRDSVVPVIEITSVTKLVSANGRDDNVNRTVTVKGTISDNDKVQSGTYTLSIGGTNVAGFVNQSVGANLTSWQFTIDTTAAGITDNSDLLIAINAADRAGNPATSKTQTVHVDQSTDTPVVKITSPAPGAYVDVGYIVRGTVSDDDGVNADKIEINYHNGTAWSGWLPISTSGGTVGGSANERTYTFTLPALGADGAKQVEVRAYDTDGYAATPVSSGAVNFSIDTTDPVINVTTPATNDVAYASGFVLDGNVVETGLETLTLSVDGNTKVTLVTGGTGTQNWSNDAGFAGLSQGRHTATLVATDKVGRSISVQRTFYRDTTGPAINFSNLTAGATPASAILTPDSIRGTVSDTYSTPKATFEYRFDTDPVDAWTTGTVSSGIWNVPIPAGLSEGAHTITVRCDDALNNRTTSAAIDFRLDRDVPEISFTPPAKTLYNANFTLTCSSADENGIEKTEYYVDNALIGTIVNNVAFTVGAGAQAAGSHTVKIVATDGVGRTAQTTFSYVVDDTDPTAYITGITPLADTTKINGTVSIAANAIDDNGIDGYAYATTDVTVTDGTTIASGDWIAFAANTVKIDFDTTAVPGWEDTTRRIWVRASDKAGNYGYVSQDRLIDQDSDRPLIKLSNISGGATDVTKYPYPTTLKNSSTLYGTITDDDGIGVFTVGHNPEIRIKNASADTWTTVTLEGSAWEFPATGTDGGKELYFQIVDINGKTYETAAAVPVATATVTGRPRIQRPTGDPLDTLTPVAFKVDTVTPEIGSTIYVDRMTPYTYAADAYTVPLTTNLPFGGSSAKFAVRALATDSNGIKEVYVKIDGIVDPIPTLPGFDPALTIPASAIVKGGVYKIATIVSTNFASEFGATVNAVNETFTASRLGTAGDTGTVMPQVYDTAEISVAALAMDSTVVTIEATDNSGLKSTATRTIIVDNVKPLVTHDSPRNNNSADQVNGNVTVKGIASDSGSGVKSLKYQIGLTADLSESSPAWKDVGGTLLSWQVDFKEGDTSGAAGIVPTKIDVYAGQSVSYAYSTNVFTLTSHGFSDNDIVYFGGAVTLPTGMDPTRGYYVRESDANTFKVSETYNGAARTFTIPSGGSDPATLDVSKYSKDPDNSGIWQLPIVLRAEDNAGNVHIETTSDYIVRVDPAGDRPVVTVIYPAPGSSPTLGGNIRIFGSAVDDDEVKEIYMQIDVDGINGYDSNDEDYEGVTKNWYNGGEGVLISGTASWNETINTSGDLNPIGGVTSDPREIHFRVRAKDKFGKYGAWSTSQTIFIDTKAPKIGSSETLTLVQGGVQKPYVADAWIKDTWYLTGSVEDESDIIEVWTVDDVEGSTTYDKSFVAGDGSWFVDVPGGTFPAPNKGYRLNIPLVTTGTGSLSFTINAKDDGDKRTSDMPIRLRFDNTAPTLEAYTGNTPITQSNKIYTLSSSVKESGSGFNKLAFYFTRTFASGGKYVYNPMVAKLSAGQKSLIDESAIKTIDGIPCLLLSDLNVDRNSDPYSFVDATLKTNPNVRIGGLVHIGGYFHLITDFDSATGKVTWDDAEVATTEENVAIAYAQVVNNTKIESPKFSNDPLAVINNDDYDGMIETIERAGDTYSWTASLDSRNIPDGPIDINCVAFDNAGNISAIRTYHTVVQNNGPRIVKLTLGTDLDGNGTVSAAEKLNTYSAIDTPALFAADTEDFIAKGLMSVDIETTGGNGALNYVATGGGITGTSLTLPTLAPSAVSGNTITMNGHPFKELQLVYLDATTTLPTGVSKGSYYVRDVAANSFAISTTATTTERVSFADMGSGLNFSGLRTILVPANMLGADTVDPATTTFTYTIWDHTEECAIGIDTQSAVVTSAIKVDAIDDVDPSVVIQPFFWRGEGSAEKNSLYGGLRANGHIEIPDGNANPAVSGEISIRGTARDNQRVTAVYIRLGDAPLTGMAPVVDGANTYATQETFGGETYYLAGAFVGGTWTYANQYGTSEGWRLVPTTKTLDQAGHDVTWRLDWDTSKLNDDLGANIIAKEGVSIKVACLDKKPNKSGTAEVKDASTVTPAGMTSGETYIIETPETGSPATPITSVGASANAAGNVFIATGAGTGDAVIRRFSSRPSSTVDVVPYINVVTTSLSQYYNNAPSVFDRTARGHYPVYSGMTNGNTPDTAGETITLTGFNLNGASTNVYLNGTPAATLLSIQAAATGSDKTKIKATIGMDSSADMKSGPLTVRVNGVTSRNNTNSDSKESNLLPNNVNNNLLNDDVYLDIWQFTEVGWSKGGGINNPNMKVSPNGRIGFSYGHSVVYFSMPGLKAGGSTYYSQTAFQKNYGWFTSNDFAFDAQGNTYGSALCPDTSANPGYTANYTFYSRMAQRSIATMGLNDNYASSRDAGGDPYRSFRLANTSLKVDTDSDGANDDNLTNIFRVRSPSMATTMVDPTAAASGTNLVRVYIAYYDDLTKEVRFRYGTVGANPQDVSWGLDDLYIQNNGTSNRAYFDNFNGPDAAAASYQVVATDGFYSRTATYPVTPTTARPGEYVALAARRINASTDVVMIAWYDSTSRQLYFSYNNDPMNINTAASRDQWQANKVVVDSSLSAGQNVKMVVDSDGGVHIAYYTLSGGDLKYAFLSGYGDTTPDVATVDSYLSVGTNCTIDVARTGGHQVPFIGYYMAANSGTSACNKVAYRHNFASNLPADMNGADSMSFYTGNWEISIVPEKQMVIPTDTQVSVGVYRDSSGDLTAIPTGAYTKATGESNGFPLSESTIVYGNGSTNPVLSYATKAGVLKMAQKLY